MAEGVENIVRIRLKPRQENRILGGHLWIFSNEIEEVEAGALPGDLAQVFSASGKFLATAFYNPKSLIAARVLSLEVAIIDQDFFMSRLSKALAFRNRVRCGQTAYRLCFGESDGLPGLVIDRYGPFVVLEVLSAGMERRLALIEVALKELLKPEGMYLKNDHRARILEGLATESRVLSGRIPDKTQIVEGGLPFLVNLGAGQPMTAKESPTGPSGRLAAARQKTGFYFDQSENRLLLRPYFKDRIVVDLYCYSGAFAVNASKFGAKSVLALDSSRPAVALAQENVDLNGVQANVSCHEADAEEALRDFSEGRQPFRPEMILLDPPSFAPSKKDLPKALRHYCQLNALALRSLPPGGMLATSTCSHHVSRELFVSMLRAAQAKARKAVRLLALQGQAGDHPILLAMPETEYLHFALLEVL